MPQKMKFFLDAMQLDYRTLSMLSQTSTHKSQCISQYSRESTFPLKGNSAINY